MPYSGERANKTSHQGIVANPTVAAFLAECDYLREPSDREAAEMVSAFQPSPEFTTEPLPERVIAIDGSPHEGNFDETRIPSTRVGYVQLGGVLVDLKQFANLRVREQRFVDPFAVARLDETADRLIFPVPSSNTTYRNLRSVRASFRAAVERHFSSEVTWTRPGDPTSSLRSTLFMLAARRAGKLHTGDPTRLLVHRCPNGTCPAGPVEVTAASDPQRCGECDGPLYATPAHLGVGHRPPAEQGSAWAAHERGRTPDDDPLCPSAR